MHRVEISEELYEEAQRRAREAGFDSVDEFISDVLKHDFQSQRENFNHCFTPERLTQIDRAAVQFQAGEFVTAEQVRAHFRRKREA